MKLPISRENHFMVAGNITSQGVKYSLVGAEATPNAKFSIAIGDKQYVNCVAWRNLADHVKNGVNGDNIFVVGKIEKRTYNDKEYEDLYCDVVVLTGKQESKVISGDVVQASDGEFITIDDTADLPF